jgi:hypothetical protein
MLLESDKQVVGPVSTQEFIGVYTDGNIVTGAESANWEYLPASYNKLQNTWIDGSGRSVGIVRSRTKATELVIRGLTISLYCSNSQSRPRVWPLQS